MMSSIVKKCLIIWTLLTLLASCSIGIGVVRTDELKYPASLSPYLPDADGTIVSEQKGLEIIGKAYTSKRFYRIVYGAFPLNDTEWESGVELNAQVEKAGGQGLVNVEIENSPCAISQTGLLNIVPIWPGCNLVEIRGDIVKVKR
jgi:hypothetical protein